MKKIIVTLFLLCLAFNTYQAFSIKNCSKTLTFDNLNSNDLLSFLKENDLLGKVSQVCSQDLCKSLSINTIEHDIQEFIKQNVKYIKSQNEELGISADLKGFRIEKLLMNDC